MALIWQKISLNTANETYFGSQYADRITEERLKQMISYIQTNYSERISLTQIAAASNISKSECMRCFKSMINISPIDYCIEYRISKAKELLENSKISAVEIAQLCGFESPAYFTKTFRLRTKFTPSDYRKHLK